MIEDIEKEDGFITVVLEAICKVPLEIKFKKLSKDAVAPTYAHNGDVGMDMTAIGVEYDDKNDMYIYHTGLAFESGLHYGQFLFPRSSNRKTDAYLCNSVGIADSAIYRGEILFCYKNRDSIQTIAEIEAMKAKDEFLLNSSTPFGTAFADAMIIYKNKKNEVLEDAKRLKYAPYKVGDRIGQMVFMRYPNVELVEQDELSDSVRGSKGFGSTGN